MKKKIIVFLFVSILISVFSFSAFADNTFSISTPLLYKSDHTHSVIYVSNGVSTQCVVMEHAYWDDPEVNPDLDFWVSFYINLYNSNGDILINYSFLEYDGEDQYNISSYDAFSGELLYSSLASELPELSYNGLVLNHHYAFPDSSYKYVYKYNEDDFYAPVDIVAYKEAIPIDSIEYGKVYNVISSSDSPSLSSVQSVILAILNFLKDLVNTIINTPLLLIPVGLFISFSVIALAFRLIRG